MLDESLGRERDHRIRRVEDRLCGAVVLLQLDDVRRGRELLRKIQDVPHGRRPEGIDGLRIVTDDREPVAIGFQAVENPRLERVRVLVFIDQDVVKPTADALRRWFGLHEVKPIQQEIVIVEDVMPLFGVPIGAEQLLQFHRPVRTPREGLLQRRLDRLPRVYRV